MGCGGSKATDTNETNNKPQDKPSEEENKQDEKPEDATQEPVEEKPETDSEEKKKTFEDDALEAHNNYRAQHGAPPMTLSRELCDIAQKWADHLAAEKLFEHSKADDRKCEAGATGENLYYSGSTGDVDIQGKAPVESWYAEIKDYDFEKGGFASNTGHFTQVVWDETKELGIAYALYTDGEWNKIVIVGNYYPAGNMMNNFEANVKPVKTEE